MKQWYKNRKKDHFYQLAKKNDLISRAYYKLEEIDKKYQNACCRLVNKKFLDSIKTDLNQNSLKNNFHS